MRKFLTMVAMLAMVCCLSGCSILVPLALLNGYEEDNNIEAELDTDEGPDFEPPTIDHLPTSPIFSDPTTEEVTEEPTTEEPTTETPTQAPTVEPAHSEYYIPGLDVDTLINYFCEVVLDAEYSSGGNASLVQKWDSKIKYYVQGELSESDMMYLQDTVDYVNSIYGFPGMEETAYEWDANLKIHFVNADKLVELMGSDFALCDGGVTFWYDDYNRIYNEIICYRNDIDQYTRNSVIIEEIYNGLGPVQDTWLRPDSIIYAEYTTPQKMTEIDELILELLYHPEIECGMDADECAEVIRKLYY